MWIVKSKIINDKTIKYKIKIKDDFLSFRDWIDLIKHSDDFIKFYISILYESEFEGYFWEVKPMIMDKLDEDFEFVLVNSSYLSRIKANSYSFEQYFTDKDSVVSFPNLGKDAFLVVPTKVNNVDCYAHLASFVRNASENQIIQLWKIVGKEYESNLGKEPKWLSTAGLGVYWLHIRIDSHPKYYKYEEYRMLKKD